MAAREVVARLARRTDELGLEHERVVEVGPGYSNGPSAVGLIEQWPPDRQSSGPNALPESKRGRQHQSIDASRETSAALWQSPISA